MNRNQSQLLNNALRRISQLESLSINSETRGGGSNRLASEPVSVPNTFSTATMSSSQVSASGLAGELRLRFPSLVNLQNSAQDTSSRHGPKNKKKRKRGQATSTSTTQKRVKAVHKDLVLIPDPEQTTVPTHSTRISLESEGYVLHSFPFDREWDSIQLKKEIEKVFPQLQSLGYDYLKASYGKLIRPNLAPGVNMTCNMLLKLSRQGSVYIRSSVKLCNESDESLSDGEDMLLSVPALEEGGPEVVEIIAEPEIEDFIPDFHYENEGLLNVPAFTADLMTIGHSTANEMPVLDHAEICPVKAVTVHRVTIKKDMIDLFQNPDILKSVLVFTIIGYDGSVEKGEGVGLAREALTSFWQQFCDSLAVGVQEKVPAIRHDFQKVHWEAIARIIIYGCIREKYFPLSLSLAFVASCLFEEENLTQEDLLKSFRMYISNDEREAYDRCSKGELSPEDDEVLEFLSCYKCYRIPNPENILSIFSELAHQELIQKPKYVVHCWASHLRALRSLPPFQTLESLRKLFEEKRPTGRKVVKLLQCEPVKEADQQCLDHLKRYIKSLQGQSLAQFLQFTTGSDIIVTEQIKVVFTSAEGFTRRPIAHTCAPMLELPNTYQCYNDLAEEFSSILADKLSWSFSIV